MPVSSFLFPTYYPDTGTGSEYLNRTHVGPFGQPGLNSFATSNFASYSLPHTWHVANPLIGASDVCLHP